MRQWEFGETEIIIPPKQKENVSQKLAGFRQDNGRKLNLHVRIRLEMWGRE